MIGKQPDHKKEFFMKNKFKLKAIRRIAGIITLTAVIGFALTALSLTGCDDGSGNTGGGGNQTPVADDYTIGNRTQTANSVTAVTITPKDDKSPGALTIYYEGTGSTTYPKNTTIPQEVGTYAVTFDVAAATGWNAATNLSAGELEVNNNKTPKPDDYTFGNMQQSEDSVTAVTITGKTGASPGNVVSIKYNGSATIPQKEGEYAVTFDVEAAEGWNAMAGLSAGTLVITGSSGGGNSLANAAELTLNTWADASILSGKEQWFKFTATADRHYIHFDFMSITGLFVQLYNADGTELEFDKDEVEVNWETAKYISRWVTNGAVSYIKVRSYTLGGGGVYRIGYNTTSTTAPTKVVLPTENIITLTPDDWADGSITSLGGVQWFKFTAVSNLRIHTKRDTINDIDYQLYNANGEPVATSATSSGQTYYIRVTSSGTGTYKIAFNDLTRAPYDTLTYGTWAEGNLPDRGEQWYKFTATASTQFIHLRYRDSVYGSEGVNFQLYTATNTNTPVVGSNTHLGSFISETVTSGATYYIKISPVSYYGGTAYGGPYRIAFNDGLIAPGTTATELTIDKWADGSIASFDGEQWFKFTATVSTQYIHFQPVTMNDIYVQLFNTTGTAVNSRDNMYDSSPTSWTVTAGNEYYIRVWPYSSRNSGAFKIAFTNSYTPLPIILPTDNVTELAVSVWADGNIAAGGVQWFKFTATAATQYIHFQPGTLDRVGVQLYDATGTQVSFSKTLYSGSGNSNYDVTVTSDSVYYIRVWPYTGGTMGSGSGAYKIGFTTSTTAPAS
jgi:hypothetical protein